MAEPERRVSVGDISINRDGPIAAEAARMARGLVAAYSTGVSSVQSLELEGAIKHVMGGSTSADAVRRRAEFLGCLLSSLAFLAVTTASQVDQRPPSDDREADLQFDPGTTMAKILRMAEENGWTF
jgi:hypothetical protein